MTIKTKMLVALCMLIHLFSQNAYASEMELAREEHDRIDPYSSIIILEEDEERGRIDPSASPVDRDGVCTLDHFWSPKRRLFYLRLLALASNATAFTLSWKNTSDTFLSTWDFFCAGLSVESFFTLCDTVYTIKNWGMRNSIVDRITEDNDLSGETHLMASLCSVVPQALSGSLYLLGWLMAVNFYILTDPVDDPDGWWFALFTPGALLQTPPVLSSLLSIFGR